jgi:hypothetical protein
MFTDRENKHFQASMTHVAQSFGQIPSNRRPRTGNRNCHKLENGDLQSRAVKPSDHNLSVYRGHVQSRWDQNLAEERPLPYLKT